MLEPAIDPSCLQNKWERNTADGAHASRTWGLRTEVLAQMAATPSEAMVEILSRLVSGAGSSNRLVLCATRLVLCASVVNVSASGHPDWPLTAWHADMINATFHAQFRLRFITVGSIAGQSWGP